HTLAGWWTDLEVANRRERKNLNTAIALVCWSIWKHRNAVVFDGATPSALQILRDIGRESSAWVHAGLLKAGSVFIKEISVN
ncbi:hypothetical protein BRADI_3g41202v3, partial [Brachypodium distachyon]